MGGRTQQLRLIRWGYVLLVRASRVNVTPSIHEHGQAPDSASKAKEQQSLRWICLTVRVRKVGLRARSELSTQYTSHTPVTHLLYTVSKASRLRFM
jgi:hypothetical protein